MMTGKGADDVETYIQSTFDNNISGINEATDSLTEIILNATRNVCRPKYITKKQKKNRWYNISCITAYRSARKVSRMLCNDPHNVFLRSMLVKLKKNV